VRDHDRRFAFHQAVQRFKYQLLGRRVEP